MTDAPKRRMTPARRLRIWTAHNGLCGGCGEPVALDECDIDHDLAVWVSRDDSDANLRPLHRDGCPASHKIKTAKDKAWIAKVKRQILMAVGAPRKPSRIKSAPFPKSSRKIQSRGFQKGLKNDPK